MPGLLNHSRNQNASRFASSAVGRLRPVGALIVLATAMVVLAACGSGSDADSDSNTVTGQIREVTDASLTEIDTLVIVDDDGREWEFRGGSFAGFTPSHVREHQVLAAPIKVRFVDEGGLLRIVAIEDG